MAINAEWKRRKTEEDKKIVKITTLDPQKDKKKDNESQRRWIEKRNERGWVYSTRICTCNPYLEIAVKGRFDLFVPVEDEQLSLKTGPLTPTARNVWKRRRLSFSIFWVESDEDFLIKKDSLLWVKQKNKLKKKKKSSVSNSINSGILTRWSIIVRDGCWRVLTRSIILTKGWIGRWFSFSFFRMFSTISSMNSDSGLQLEV